MKKDRNSLISGLYNNLDKRKGIRKGRSVVRGQGWNAHRTLRVPFPMQSINQYESIHKVNEGRNEGRNEQTNEQTNEA